MICRLLWKVLSCLLLQMINERTARFERTIVVILVVAVVVALDGLVHSFTWHATICR
jgi:hypothetical protein